MAKGDGRVTPLMLEKPPEPVEKISKPTPQIAEPLGGFSGVVTEPTPGSVLKFRLAPQSDATESNDHADKSESPLRIELIQGDAHERGSRLRQSFEALGKLRTSRSTADWLEAAAALKTDALRLRNSPLARHSSVLLALADALTFTDPADSALNIESYEALEQGLSLLSEPFIGEPAEENFLVRLMSTGWNLAPEVNLEAVA
jgi:hypothetical protein